MKPKISNDILKLSNIFHENGKSLYIVGGFLRDLLYKVKSKDIDLATNAEPNDVIKILEKHNMRYTAHGKSFGVVVLYTEENPLGLEIATFRKDGIGRKPTVEFIPTIEEDLKRRDITISALAYDIYNSKFVDVCGSVSDIEKNIIRMVGNPKERINEDKLRILRVGRFLARFDSTLDPETLNAICLNNDLKDVSKERVWDEIYKTYKTSKNINKFYTFCYDVNLWSEIFENSNISENVIPTGDIVLDLAMLLKDNGYDKNYLTSKFKIPLDYSAKIGFLIRFIKDFKADDVFLWYKDFMRCGLSKKQLKQWLYNNTVSTYYTKFIYYEPVYTSIQIMDLLGIPHTDGKPDDPKLGKAIGDTMKEKEAERYAALIR